MDAKASGWREYPARPSIGAQRITRWINLRGNGREVFVHTVITCGQALVDTLNGFHELAQTTQERNIVVWVNEYFGRVEADVTIRSWLWSR